MGGDGGIFIYSFLGVIPRLCRSKDCVRADSDDSTKSTVDLVSHGTVCIVSVFSRLFSHVPPFENNVNVLEKDFLKSVGTLEKHPRRET